MTNENDNCVLPPEEKLDELASRLEAAKFIKSIIDCPSPLVKSLKCDSEGAYVAVVSGIKGFLKDYLNSILDGPPEDEEVEEINEPDSVFSEEEVLILKAYCSRQMANPKVQQIMGKATQLQKQQHTMERQKPSQPARGGKRGKIVDPSDVIGYGGDDSIDSGTEIVALAKHSVDGYWQVALASNPKVRFVMNEEHIAWAEG